MAKVNWINGKIAPQESGEYYVILKDTSVTEYEHCCLTGQTVRYDDFCSYGERKGGNVLCE